MYQFDRYYNKKIHTKNNGLFNRPVTFSAGDDGLSGSENIKQLDKKATNESKKQRMKLITSKMRIYIFQLMLNYTQQKNVKEDQEKMLLN